MSLINEIQQDLAAKGKQSGTANQTERKPSDFWLNIGIKIPGAGEGGEDLFVSLPVGLALDDMKPQAVRGTNQEFIQLVQTKNALLEALQKNAAKLQPGERVDIPELKVELYRRNEPAQTGDINSNPLMRALLEQLGGKSN